MIVPQGLQFRKLIPYMGPTVALLFAYDMLVVLLYFWGWTWISLPTTGFRPLRPRSITTWR